MAITIIENEAQLQSFIGKTVAVSEWITVTQDRINLFADATDDHQWIHVDPARAKNQSPFQTTIAHGFLSLSLMSGLLASSIQFKHASMGVNYGLNKVRFPEVVTVNSQVRAHFLLQALEKQADNSVQLTWHVTVERQGAVKPCIVAEWLTRFY